MPLQTDPSAPRKRAPVWLGGASAIVAILVVDAFSGGLGVGSVIFAGLIGLFFLGVQLLINRGVDRKRGEGERDRV